MIIEDDIAIGEELAFLLKNEGYHPFMVKDFTDISGQAQREHPDLILLDIGLPDKDGFSLCVSLKSSVNVPVIFVTSRDSSMDEVRALSMGGDDYITKPYNIPVLLARIKAVLRRKAGTNEPEIIEAAGLRLDLTKGIVSTENKKAVLTRNELQILACLMQGAGKIISRADLMESLWDNRIYIDDNTLSVNVTRLRVKLAELGMEDLIKMRRGMGYQL